MIQITDLGIWSESRIKGIEAEQSGEPRDFIEDVMLTDALPRKSNRATLLESDRIRTLDLPPRPTRIQSLCCPFVTYRRATPPDRQSSQIGLLNIKYLPSFAKCPFRLLYSDPRLYYEGGFGSSSLVQDDGPNAARCAETAHKPAHCWWPLGKLQGVGC